MLGWLGRLTCGRLDDLEGQHVGVSGILLTHAASMPDRLSIGKSEDNQTDPLPKTLQCFFCEGVLVN